MGSIFWTRSPVPDVRRPRCSPRRSTSYTVPHILECSPHQDAARTKMQPILKCSRSHTTHTRMQPTPRCSPYNTKTSRNYAAIVFRLYKPSPVGEIKYHTRRRSWGVGMHSASCAFGESLSRQCFPRSAKQSMVGFMAGPTTASISCNQQTSKILWRQWFIACAALCSSKFEAKAAPVQE